VDQNLIDKLQKILALTTSPVEGEAQAAAAMLAKLLEKHNLSMADLEQKGAAAPGVREMGVDLGKAAFTWKLDLAEAIADYYFCFGMVDRYRKTVVFIGRPDNVESLKMLYNWLIDQIKRISTDERKAHTEQTSEHIDPLRWQVHFGVGAVDRLKMRLAEERERVRNDAGTMALVIHHQTEIGDFMEDKYGYRADGQKTRKQRERDERWQRERNEYKARQNWWNFVTWVTGDVEDYYQQFPYERPKTAAQKAADEQYKKEWEKRERRNRKARERREANGGRTRYISMDEWNRREQGRTANRAGRAAAERITLHPFVAGGGKQETQKEIK